MAEAQHSPANELRAALAKYAGVFVRNRRRFLAIVFLAAVIHFSNMMGERGGEYTTIRLHIYFAEQIAAGAMTIFHGMFFDTINALYALGVPRTVAATIFLSACVTIVAYQTYLYLAGKLAGLYSHEALCAITAATLLVNAIWLPFLTRGVYLGQWGPNMYHNATVTTVKLFSIPVFVLVAVLLRNGAGRAWWRDLALAAALLAVSMYAKPTLYLVIAPGAVLYALCARSPWRDRIITLAVVLTPATAFVFYQRYAAYGAESSLFTGRWMEVQPFWVWSQWTRSVPASIALTLAFPAAVTWLTRRERARDDELTFAWLLVLAGFLQAALLVEVDPVEGPLRSANWFGGYVLANHLLFIVACAAFFGWYGRLAPPEKRSPGARLALALLALHVVSGLVYIARLGMVVSAFA